MIEGGGRPRLVGPALELAGLGAGLTLTAALMAALPSWARALGTFQTLYVLAFVFYALALGRIERYRRLPHVGLAVFAVALATRMALMPVTPSLSDDVYRYVWEGRVLAHGGDPWRQAPDDPALAPLRDRVIHPRINHPHLATIYPPLGIAGFALVTRISPTVAAMKLWVTLNDLAVVLVLLAWLRRREEGAATAIAYAWNPLVLVEFAGSGHNDPTAIVWLVVALALAERRPVASGLALAAASLVKLVPLVALPLLVRRWPWRARIACVVPLVLGLGWFWAHTRGANSGLQVYWDTWRNNELVFLALEKLGGFRVGRAIALGLVAAAIGWALWRRRAAAAGARLAIRTGIVAGPVVHPWYLGWALAFEPLGPSVPWLLLSLTATLNYGVFATPAAGLDHHPSLATRCVEYGLPLLLAIAIAVRRRRGSPPSDPPGPVLEVT